ncbi:MAG: pyruvate, phosphate dikinase [Spirochaetes bacterium GWD1_61_31]|nr:MAG: pyruvate, phosphate dikinase [Spirochaetes bacterium GWB1_60_80]OHD31515.1 MAG: pyruvate, phosphate dikinase [Spirochaetes bacterium GWC1_61_12]OHD43292.1 MAG: pyruvate, phosphate dikinase [Spirochaetes bacterium GWD1_61_31]OHD45618.1 MAG: pyruvate, phosphate dikinase [Spirochaetes bacterium GWE1_60_18]OHD60469.1 MAG: pyruvate, phosphate dikinase [Spirochaetes bacterium GWF1_60_12]HAP44730.1 pyruvate, phosphate dikinase [Spirochaetaceae bacterium]
MKNNVHFFSQNTTIKGNVDLQKLGQRGRQANEFAVLKFPILPGFIIDSDVASKLADEKVIAALKPFIKQVEAIVEKKLAADNNPLLLKIVLSPNLAISNYPTLHNFGLTRQTVKGFNLFVGANFTAHEVVFLSRGMLKIEEKIAELENRTDDLMKIRARIVGASNVLDSEAAESKAEALMDAYADLLPKGFFDDAEQQLEIALQRISLMLALDAQDDEDTAILVQPMVYGNYCKNSASGAFYTRNVVTGDKHLQGEYFEERFDEIGAEGKDINKIAPQHLKPLEKIAQILEDQHTEIRQVRFTIENNKLWLIEQRQVVAKSTQSDMRLYLDLHKRKVVDDAFLINSIQPARLAEILHPIINIASVKKLKGLAGGITGAPGAAIGRVFFSTESLLDAFRIAQQKGEDKRLILCMTSTFAEDVKAIEVASGVLSCEGGYSAHASVVARQYGKVSLVKPEMKIRGRKATIGDFVFNEGDFITINVPYHGEPHVWQGTAELIEPDPAESGLFDFIAIVKKNMKHFHVRANADNPRDTALALQFGADGIGLCRTEHMFFNEKRINVFREMILAENAAAREKALKKLESMQRDDFYSLFKIMAGKEVTIRLLDAPLHEFLPHNETEFEAFMAHLNSGGKKGKATVSKSELKARIDTLAEFNPMLGHRGCRIAVSYPAIYAMQMRAIFQAVYQLKSEKVDVMPEIMIPIVMNSAELKLIIYGKKIEGTTYKGLVEIEEEIRKEFKAKPCEYRKGTMIELPAAALQAGEIARYSEFFSFGTNDLTQTTLGISRDDFNSFMPDYSLFDLVEGNPFSNLVTPVKELVGLAVRRGKMTRPGLTTGLCGEHGANPDNIRFCMEAGLDYVSCSPYSVPIACLAIAQLEFERAKAT